MIRSILNVLFFVALMVLADEAEQTKKVKLSWDSVNEATDYELEIKNQEKVLMTEKVKALEWETRLPVGNYSYRVRAIDEFGRPGEWTTEEVFEIAFKDKSNSRDYDRALGKPSSSLALQLSSGRYDYKSRVSDLGFGNINSAEDFTAAVELDYWISPKFGIKVLGSYNKMQVSGKDIGNYALGAAAVYPLIFTQKLYFVPALGLNYQSFPGLYFDLPDPNTLQVKDIGVLSLSAGIDAGFYLSERLSVVGKIGYLLPYRLNMQGGDAKEPSSSNFLQARLGVSYVISDGWDLGLFYGMENRELGLKTDKGTANIEKKSQEIMLQNKLRF